MQALETLIQLRLVIEGFNELWCPLGLRIASRVYIECRAVAGIKIKSWGKLESRKYCDLGNLVLSFGSGGVSGL